MEIVWPNIIELIITFPAFQPINENRFWLEALPLYLQWQPSGLTLSQHEAGMMDSAPEASQSRLWPKERIETLPLSVSLKFV